MNEKEIADILGRDHSAGTEAFRDRLLERCLAEINGAGEIHPIDDDELDLLAAAGSPFEMRASETGSDRDRFSE